jgi:uncharacterized phage protein gp47/JayE
LSLIASNTDYTDKDFDSIRARFYALLKSVFPEWTDSGVASFGNILLDLYADVADKLLFYQDNQAAEAYLPTATQRKNLLALCKLIGFVPDGAVAATVTVAISIPATTAGDVVFPAGTIVRTGDIVSPIKFQLLAQATIPAGSTSVEATAEHSETAEDTFTSSGLAYQELALSRSPYLDDSAAVVAADGTYTQVATFVNSSATDKHFTVVVDQRDQARIRFGNGVLGKVPSGSITVTYKTGGGAKGNVEPGSLSVIEGAFTDTLANAVAVSVTNALKAAGGSDRMSNAKIRERAPESIRAPINSVSRDDFETNLRKVSGVARAIFLTSNEDPSIPENTGIGYVIPTGGGLPSSGLKAACLTQITVNYPPTLTFTPSIQDPSLHEVDVRTKVYFRKGVNKATVATAIRDALSAFFAVENEDGSTNENVDWGGNIEDFDGDVVPAVAWSDVFNAIRDVSGVRKVEASTDGLTLNGEAEDISLLAREFPILGDVEIVDAETGDSL